MSTEPGDPPVLAVDGAPVVLRGRCTRADAKHYLVLPVGVPAGAHRVEVAYWWSPEHDTVLDLGLWDERGYRDPAGFRGWSGSRQGRRHLGQAPVWVQDDDADRCYRPGPVRPGTWYVELGVGAVAESGAEWTVEVRARSVATGAPPAPDPVDAGHVASTRPGWYHGDFHQHGHHSNPSGPSWEELVGYSRDAGLAVLPVIEYVVGCHWDELGALQRAHPDVLVWPGREVITYWGHAVTHGETPGVLEYRHGFEDVRLADVQAAAIAAGALFQVAHPTTYPEDVFGDFCRGCEFRLGGEIDWDRVDTLEVVTGPVALGEPPSVANPFTLSALELWYERLRAGHRICAVSGSDDKLGPDYGSTATALWLPELSRAAVVDAVRAGHAYVRARGVADSPQLGLRAVGPDGSAGIFGDTLDAAEAELRVTVSGGAGQELRVRRDGRLVEAVALTRDEQTHARAVTAGPDAGPLGTFWSVETHDGVAHTTIGNPVFLQPGAGPPER